MRCRYDWWRRCSVWPLRLERGGEGRGKMSDLIGVGLGDGVGVVACQNLIWSLNAGDKSR